MRINIEIITNQPYFYLIVRLSFMSVKIKYVVFTGFLYNRMGPCSYILAEVVAYFLKALVIYTLLNKPR